MKEKPPRPPPWPRAVDAPAAQSSSPIEGEVTPLRREATVWRTVKTAAERIADSKAIVIAFVSVFGALAYSGWYAKAKLDELVTHAEVSAVRTETARALAEHAAAAHASTSLRLDAVEDRVLVVEVSLTWLVRATESIANRVGAVTPPTPQPVQP